MAAGGSGTRRYAARLGSGAAAKISRYGYGGSLVSAQHAAARCVVGIRVVQAASALASSAPGRSIILDSHIPIPGAAARLRFPRVGHARRGPFGP